MIQDPREGAKYLLTVFGLAALIVLVVMIAATLGHATTTSQHRNSLGVVMYEQNPNVYEAGEVVNYVILDHNKGLVLRVQPLAAYALYTDEILFCGVPADKLDGHENPMVLVYEKVAHKMVEGVGCHELVTVRDIKGEKMK
jgi:hypothetical protein